VSVTVGSPDAAGTVVAAGAVVADSPLRRELGRFDTVLFLISATVVLDTLGAVAVGGGQALTWLAVVALTFFVPSALLTAELGAALPAEGGAYVWVRTALGRRWAAVASLLYWAGTPVWVGGSLVAVAISVLDAFVVPLTVPSRYLVGCLLLMVATGAGVVPLRYGKWIPSSGALVQIALLTFFTVTVLAYGARHGVHGIALRGMIPTAPVFFAVAPVLAYSFVGVELPSAAAEEMRDPRRDVPAAVLRAGVAQVVMYGVPVLAVLMVLPPARLTSLRGFIDAFRTVLTVYGGRAAPDGGVVLTGAGAAAGYAVAVAFVWALMAAGATWLMGASRTQAAACLDGGGPRGLGVVSPISGVPVRMTLVSGGAATAVFVAGVAVTHGDAQRYFTIVLVGAILCDLSAFLLIYPSFGILRRRRPDLPRPFRVPGGDAVAWLVTGLATAWTVVSLGCLLWAFERT
jgi:amino acid transporter